MGGGGSVPAGAGPGILPPSLGGGRGAAQNENMWLFPAGMSLAGAGLSAYEQGEAGKATANYYNYLAGTSEINAGLTQARSEAERIQIGQESNLQEQHLASRISQTVGAQRAALATGAGASSRTAQDVITDTLDKGSLDEMALRTNSDIRSRNAELAGRIGAFNYGNQAAGYRMAGVTAVNAARMGQVSSLLGGAGSVANSYFMGSMYGQMGGYRYGGRMER